MSQIFEAFRAVGYICDDVKCAVLKRGSDTFVAASVGHAYQLYNCNKLNLLFVGPTLELRVRALAMAGDFVYVAAGNNVHAYKRGKEASVYSHDGGNVVELLPLGAHLLCLCEDGHVIAWDTDSGEIDKHFQLTSDMGEPSVSRAAILLGSRPCPPRAHANATAQPRCT